MQNQAAAHEKQAVEQAEEFKRRAEEAEQKLLLQGDESKVRIHCIIVMIDWTGLAPWEFEFPFQVALHLPSWCTAGSMRTFENPADQLTETGHVRISVD